MGQTILRQKKLKQIFQKYEQVFFIIVFLIIIIAYVFLNNNNFFDLDKFILDTIILSLIGTLIMLVSLRKRHKSLFEFFSEKKKYLKEIFFIARQFSL